MVSYGLAYGMEAYGLSQRLGIPMEEAQEILDAYFGGFPSVRDYMEQAVVEARSPGYTVTAFGRRRSLPDLHSTNNQVRKAAERQAMNAGIQGLAADLFKIALIRLDAGLDEGGSPPTWSSRFTTRCWWTWTPTRRTGGRPHRGGADRGGRPHRARSRWPWPGAPLGRRPREADHHRRSRPRVRAPTRTGRERTSEWTRDGGRRPAAASGHSLVEYH